MLEKLHGVPQRIADLKRKLAAREGKPEFRENVPAIKAEIARLEAVSASRDDLEEFIADEAGGAASGDDQEKVT